MEREICPTVWIQTATGQLPNAPVHFHTGIILKPNTNMPSPKNRVARIEKVNTISHFLGVHRQVPNLIRCQSSSRDCFNPKEGLF